MFSVLFEVQPRADQWEAYLGNAKLLRPELEKIDGFIDNIRYRSLTRAGCILSLSNWRDEKALVRWRTHALHHGVQKKGRAEILRDYHLRVGQVTRDTRLPDGHGLQEQRLDETETGAAKTVTMVDTAALGKKVQRRKPGRRRAMAWPRCRCRRARRVGRVRCGADARRRDPADVVAQSGRRGSVRGGNAAAGRRAAAARPHCAGLRHVRPSRGAAILRCGG